MTIRPAYMASVWAAAAVTVLAPTVHAQRQMEWLDRGLVAVQRSDGTVYVGWRMLGTEPDSIAFNVYRDGVRVNETPIADSTNFVDDRGAGDATYAVCAIFDGSQAAPSKPATVWKQDYVTVPLRTPEGYRPNDASVGDLDGDGAYEVVLHQAGRSRDNASRGMTDPPILEAYRLDGTFLWRINLGRNIREGAHYTQFMVYDLDGDGRAEVACKTADGTTDGTGKVIGDPNANWVNRDGKILDGPEFFTVFDGQTGAALATADYIPPRGDIGGWGGIGGNGSNDHNGNRVDRMLACVAYLDGTRPSVVMCRGYYGRSVLAAWDWRDGRLTSRWVFDSATPGLEKYSGQGNHNLTVADVDADGRDEIIYGSMCVDDDGSGLYSTDLRHGDAMHVGDLDPARGGLEVWGIHENEVVIPGYEDGFGAAMFDAGTGEILWGKSPGRDVGRGVAADIDPRYPGAECWWSASSVLCDARGQEIGPRPRSQNFVVWWDGDLLRETLDGIRIAKWDWKGGVEVPLMMAEGCSSNNGSKSTPALSADLFGDWREEVTWRSRDGKELRIYTTTMPTAHRFYTLMHDPQYRLSIAWQNVAYNQPPHVGFFLGAGMAPPPRPNIRLAGRSMAPVGSK
ncbi:MAG: rhamnogalacturonan lyase [Sedimentisphaerales bacterium]|nr:rhamnogalacturonan lyase [Sedimentisphaerales bacterium]HNY77827.1 rhamnogalacturonan lyase [Sedimentisphaerales bacterium]HOC63124.1 rhamnogalacturonan lyase [Sedimentisphaerales bacterium]HOH64002.1 rhamnogalacturonan lyase [Sedimentisphaerales bacterium]HPY50159.1 rhamnogalacturonan lyase [Sedimentisphaerales bacterium]